MSKTQLEGSFALCLLPFACAVLVPARAATSRDDAPSNLTSQLSTASLDAETRAAFLAAATDVEPYESRFSADGVAPVTIHLWLKRDSADQRERVEQGILRALQVFTVWYGSFPYAEVIVVDTGRGPSPSESEVTVAGASYPSVIAINTRWIAPARDVSVERSLVGALARQYVFGAATRDASSKWFDEAWALYSGTRAVHEVLENGNPATVRFFGGHLPVVIRPVQLSLNRADPRPRVRHFEEIDDPPVAAWRSSSAEPGGRAQQAATALHSLERYIGWPAMQQALATYRARASTNGGSPELFASVASEERGRDLSWFFSDAFRPQAVFDYAVDRLTSERASDAAGQYRTTVGLRRVGNAMFAGTNEPLVAGIASGRALTVSVVFEDGSEVDEHWDGRESAKELEYLSRSPVALASVDPEAVLLLDNDRPNNTRRLRPSFHRVGARLALQWIVWLQDLMLSYGALA